MRHLTPTRLTGPRRLAALALCLTLAAAMAACSSSSGGGSDVVQTAVFGVVTDASGSPVAGATVNVGGAVAATDASGAFAVAAIPGDTIVRVDAEGYLPAIRPAVVTAEATSAVDVRLLERAAPVTLDATVGGRVDGARGAAVDVPAGALVDPSGAAVTGTVMVYVTPIDPSDDVELLAAPGDFRGRSAASAEVQIESFGMMDVTIEAEDGTELDVASGATLTLSIPAPADASDLPDEVPAWSFDEDAGVWVEEGTLTLDADAGVYVGEVPHLSFWNADREIDVTCISGTVVDDADGQPLAGTSVSGRGMDYFGYESTHTDAEGRFAVLVRTSSRVLVTASHEAGGGTQREAMSGDTVVGLNVTPDDPGCVDVGELRVQRGVVELADGSVVSCDTNVLADFRTCSAVLVAIGECHAPAGACTNNGGLFDLSYEFENGARLETSFDDSGTVTSEFYGPGGVYCGEQVVAGASGQLTVTDAAGNTDTLGFSAGADGSATWTCADGSTRTLSPAQQDAIAACSGGSADSCDDGDGSGGGNIGEACETDAQCTGGTTCCFGACLPEAICSIGPEVCESDAECEGDDICCPGTGSCSPVVECGDLCVTDGDCEAKGYDGPCCDGACVWSDTCSGQCDTDADCGGDNPICCPPYEEGGDTFCTDTQNSCWAYRDCEVDADCGDSGELLCCPGDDGGQAQCRTELDCYEEDECEVDADCGDSGELQCCMRPEFEGAGFCQTELTCNSFTPCEADTDCFEGLICCASFGDVCVQPELCF